MADWTRRGSQLELQSFTAAQVFPTIIRASPPRRPRGRRRHVRAVPGVPSARAGGVGRRRPAVSDCPAQRHLTAPVKGGDAAVGPRRHHRVQRHDPVERRLRPARQVQARLRLAAAERPRPIASISKAYLDTLLGDAGTVGLDDELATHLALSMRNPYGTAGKVTLRNLASRPPVSTRSPQLLERTSAPRATSSRTRARDARPPPNRRSTIPMGIALLGRASGYVPRRGQPPPSFAALHRGKGVGSARHGERHV